MTESNEAAEPIGSPIEPIEGGIAIIPKTDKRPIAIVGMGSSAKELDQIKQLSERLKQVGMEHVVLSIEDAEKEGIKREDLVSAQLEQSQTNGLLGTNPIFDGEVIKKRGFKSVKVTKRKKKGKKTHRKR